MERSRFNVGGQRSSGNNSCGRCGLGTRLVSSRFPSAKVGEWSERRVMWMEGSTEDCKLVVTCKMQNRNATDKAKIIREGECRTSVHAKKHRLQSNMTLM